MDFILQFLGNFTLMLQLRIRHHFPPQICKNREKQKKGDKRKFLTKLKTGKIGVKIVQGGEKKMISFLRFNEMFFNCQK